MLHIYSGGQRSSGHFDTKKDAVNRACEISKNQETELVIHNKDGKLEAKMVMKMIHLHLKANYRNRPGNTPS